MFVFIIIYNTFKSWQKHTECFVSKRLPTLLSIKLAGMSDYELNDRGSIPGRGKVSSF
jgi:hypothetical protein